MAVSLLHQYQSAIADSGDTSVVQPSDWNAEHTITMAPNKLLGRGTAGTGAVEEITLGTGLTLTGTTLDASGGVTGPGSSTANALVRWSSTGGTALLNNTQWTLGDDGALASSGMSLTGSQATSLIDLAATWNTTGTPTAIKLNVTNTASNAASSLLDLQVGGLSKLSINRDGRIYANIGASYRSRNGATLYDNTYVDISGHTNTVNIYSNSSSSTAPSLILDPTSARFIGPLEVRNSTNAQAFRVYGTYTDASNYVRGALSASTSAVTLAGETAGSGADDIDVIFTPAGAGAVRFGTHSAIAAETVTGYITIKDSGGTSRKIAVVS